MQESRERRTSQTKKNQYLTWKDRHSDPYGDVVVIAISDIIWVQVRQTYSRWNPLLT